jgi:hypothetical protein
MDHKGNLYIDYQHGMLDNFEGEVSRVWTDALDEQ